MLAKLHARLGDFWWYSLMLFCACRAADLLNAFVGLWLVPKYVDPSELGAVQPLTQFATRHQSYSHGNHLHCRILFHATKSRKTTNEN